MVASGAFTYRLRSYFIIVGSYSDVRDGESNKSKIIEIGSLVILLLPIRVLR